MSVFIIGEAGSNHNQSLEQAFSLIDVAKNAGCDAVKFQLFSSNLYANNTPDFGGYKDIPDLISKCVLPRVFLPDIKDYCDRHSIEFLATPFDVDAVNILVDLGVKRIKIAAYEGTDALLVTHCARTNLPIIFSAGVGATINKTIKWIRDAGTSDITVLHCISSYPTPPQRVYLNQISKLKRCLRGVSIGFSDHTLSTLTPALAVPLGATVIEKHFTLSRKLPGPDHKFSLEPNELREMVENVRYAEKCVGYRDESISFDEANLSKARRAVYAKVNIKSGEMLSEENITTQRPLLDGCIPASEYYNLLNKRAVCDINSGEPIKTYYFN